jgi:hypothetical protein
MKSTPARVEKDLLDALERLKMGTPKNTDLAKKARAGKLRINPTTVAREAGCSRTLIGHENCIYPKIRNQIREYKDETAKPATSFEEINRQLRRDNLDLKEAVRLAMSRVAAMELQLKAEETTVTREVLSLRRQLKKALESPDSPSGSNVSNISAKRKRP